MSTIALEIETPPALREGEEYDLHAVVRGGQLRATALVRSGGPDAADDRSAAGEAFLKKWAKAPSGALPDDPQDDARLADLIAKHVK